MSAILYRARYGLALLKFSVPLFSGTAGYDTSYNQSKKYVLYSQLH
ncbi:MAG: hypothetical protein AAGF85_06185 [Bacteroidota bacterium]